MCYQQVAPEAGTIGGASFNEILVSQERTPHDMMLQISDDPEKDNVLTTRLQTYF